MLVFALFVLSCALLWAAAGLSERVRFKMPRGVAGVGKLLPIALILYMFADVTGRAEEDRKKIAVLFVIFLVLAALLLLSERIKQKYKKIPNMTGVLAAVTPLCCFFLTEYVYSDYLRRMATKYKVLNVAYLAVLFLILFCALPWKRFAVGMFWIVCFLFGATNHYLTLFRGNPLMPTDFLSVGTALDVAGGYEFAITRKLLFGALMCLGCITVLCLSPKKERPETEKKRRTARAAINVLAALLGLLLVSSVNIMDNFHIYTNLWNIPRAYNKAGSVLSFANLSQEMRIARPEDYDRESTNELLESYEPKEEETGAVRPTVIAIMVEAFSDLRAMGDFEVPEEYLENWYARTDYLYRGGCYVSVLGGNTANSEFEFLTGNSMGFLPSGIVPYRSYGMKKVGNLASILEDEAYLRVALHPAKKRNWNREKVYADFGFEKFFGKKDFAQPVYIRSRISDTCDFEKLIELYEMNQGKQQFLFNVTLQNHGGYEVEDMAGRELIRMKEGWEKYTDVVTYLTLMKESDRAIEQLISYFEEVDEPVILCIFGDHQPALDEEWTETVLGQTEDSLALQDMQKRYVTPYLIWANYDTGIEQREMDLSANYLGALLLEAAGFQGSAYTNFLLDMRKYVPAINAFGYMTADGSWHSMDEETEVSEWIDKYRDIEYNAVFDSGKKAEYYR